MGVKFANNAYGTLNASITNTDTSLTLSSGQGARFPSLGAGDYFYATLIDTSNNLEIVKCTARSSDVLTITRGQEGTTARAYSVGDRVELRITAQALVENLNSTDVDVILPSQTGNSGEYLTTNGSVSSWAALPPSDDASALTTGTLDNARLGTGVVVSSTYYTNNTQISLPSQTSYTILSGTHTKQYANSKVVILFNGYGRGGSSGHCGLFFTYGGTTNYEHLDYAYNDWANTHIIAQGVLEFTGKSAGSQSWSFGWSSVVSGGERPANYWNPNQGTLDSRARNAGTSIWFLEVMA